jgi:hypothetical protein
MDSKNGKEFSFIENTARHSRRRLPYSWGWLVLQRCSLMPRPSGAFQRHRANFASGRQGNCRLFRVLIRHEIYDPRLDTAPGCIARAKIHARIRHPTAACRRRSGSLRVQGNGYFSAWRAPALVFFGVASMAYWILTRHDYGNDIEVDEMLFFD